MRMLVPRIRATEVHEITVPPRKLILPSLPNHVRSQWHRLDPRLMFPEQVVTGGTFPICKNVCPHSPQYKTC